MEGPSCLQMLIYAPRHVVAAAVKQNGNALLYASDKLKARKEIVTLAVKNYGPSLQHAHPNLQRDHDICLAACRQAGQSIEYAHYDIRRFDRKVIKAAVRNCGWAIKFLHEEARNDEEILTIAIRNSPKFGGEFGNALQFVPEWHGVNYIRKLAGWELVEGGGEVEEDEVIDTIQKYLVDD